MNAPLSPAQHAALASVQLDDRYTLETGRAWMSGIHALVRLPIMQRLAKDLDQSCHLTVYSQGKQVVLAKVDTPSGMGFSVRAGSELDVLISVSGRVLLAFQDEETRKLWIEESLQRRPEQADPQTGAILDTIRTTGFESIPSMQVRGLYAVSFPILDTQGRAIAALTVPYSERIDQNQRKSIPAVTEALGHAARTLSQRVGGMSMGSFSARGAASDTQGRQAKQYA